MTESRPPAPGATLGRVAGALLSLVALVGLVLLLRDAGEASLRAAPIAIVAPDVVAAPLAEDVRAATGGALDPLAAPDRVAAEEALARREVAAVLVVDLRGSRDQLVLAPGTARLQDALRAQVEEVAGSYGREVVVTPPPGVEDAPAPLERPAATVLLALLLGWVAVAAVSGLRGAYPATPARGAIRAGVTAAFAAAAGAGGLVVSGDAGVAVVLAATAAAAGAVTQLAEAVVGRAGVVLGGLVCIGVAVPIARAGDLLLLPETWRPLLEATPAGAAATLLPLGAEGLRGWPAVTLAAWVVGPLVAMLLIRVAVLRARGPRGRVAHPAPAPGPGAPAPVSGRLRAGVLGLLVVVLAGTALRAATPTSVRTTPVADLAARSTCVDTGAVGGVADLNRITRLRGRPEFQGGDVGVEARLQGGRTLWLFGDTLRRVGEGGSEEGVGFVRNSGLLVEPGCLQAVLAADGGALVPDRADGVGYWPMSLTVQREPGYDVVTALLQRVRTGDRGVFDIEILGPTAAVLVAPVGETPQLLSVRDLGADRPGTEQPMWGAASVLDRGWLHLYGTSRPEGEGAFGFAVSVARVRPEQVLDRSAWRYWDGAAWSPRADDAAELLPAVGGVSQTFSVFRRGPTWYAFSKRDDVLGDDLVFWRAGAPTGPFEPAPVTAELPSDLAGGQLRYMPLAHPELLPRRGSVVVSYSRNSTDVGAVVEDPLLYRPRFLRLPLPSVGIS